MKPISSVLNLLHLLALTGLAVVFRGTPAAAQTPLPPLPQIQTQIHFERGGGTGKFDLRSSDPKMAPDSWSLAGGEFTMGGNTFVFRGGLLGVVVGRPDPAFPQKDYIVFEIWFKGNTGRARPSPSPVGYGYIKRDKLDRGHVEGKIVVNQDPGRGTFDFTGRGATSGGGAGGTVDLAGLLRRVKADDAEARLRQEGFTDVSVQRLPAAPGMEGKFIRVEMHKVAISADNPRGVIVAVYYYEETAARDLWVHSAGEFAKTIERFWIERDSTGAITYEFVELVRNDEYVEIHDPVRVLSLRLYATRITWRRDGLTDWADLYSGDWRVR